MLYAIIALAGYALGVTADAINLRRKMRRLQFSLDCTKGYLSMERIYCDDAKKELAELKATQGKPSRPPSLNIDHPGQALGLNCEYCARIQEAKKAKEGE